MKIKEALEKLENKNFNISFNTNEKDWELYFFDNTGEIKKYFNENCLNDILESYLNEKIENSDSNEMYYLQDEYTNIYCEFDVNYNSGYLVIELDGYEDRYNFKNFDEFIKEIENIENTVDIFKLNVNSWEYEGEHPYESRGLTMRDFL